MKNQRDIRIAAHTAAANSLEIKTPLALHKFKAAQFEATGAEEKHFDIFSRQFDAERATLEILSGQSLEPEKPEKE